MTPSSTPWRRFIRIARHTFGGPKDKKETVVVPSILRMSFDSVYYVQMYPDVAAAEISPLTHYVLYGAKEGRNPTSYFSTSDYVAKFGSRIPHGMNPFLHFLLEKEAEMRAIPTGGNVSGPASETVASETVASETVASETDPGQVLRTVAANLQLPFYIEFNNLDGKEFDTDEDAARHYIDHGAALGYDPHIGFSTTHYLASCPDVANAGVNPFFHYLAFGMKEGRSPLPRNMRRRAHGSLADLFLRLPKTPSKGRGAKGLRGDVSIVVPVFNALNDVKDLLGAMSKTLHRDQEILLVDDGSSDPGIQKTLQKWVRERPGARVISLKENVGYSAAVNAGMMSSQKHVVILNTDLLLPAGWLDRILAPIDRQPDDVATVTPFSNTSSLTGFPELSNEGADYLDLSVDEIDRVFQANRYDFDLPSGCGFCLAINRHAIEKTGSFDSKTYGRGYYEETDWCQRAARNGFRHVIAPDLYVHHKPGSASFGVGERLALSNQNRPKFVERNPHYRDRLRLYRLEDPGAESRQLTKLRLWQAKASDCIATLSHTWGGGTETFSQFSQKTSVADGALIMNFRLHGTWAHADFVFGRESLKFENISFSNCVDIIKRMTPSRIDIHGLHGTNDPQHLADLLSTEFGDCDLHFYVHDFLTVCPSVHLLDYSGRFCNVPSKEFCHKCLAQNKHSMFPAFSIPEWRSRWHGFLRRTSKIVTFHSESARLIRKAYPDIADRIIVSEPEYKPNLRSVPAPPASKKLRIGVFGRLDYHKGAEVVGNLCELLRKSGQDTASVHLFGSWPSGPLPPNIVAWGPYVVSEMPDLIKETAIDVALFPSICPETYSFTLSELFATNIPVVAFDIGAQGARVREYSHGVVCSDTDPATVLAALMQASSLRTR